MSINSTYKWQGQLEGGLPKVQEPNPGPPVSILASDGQSKLIHPQRAYAPCEPREAFAQVIADAVRTSARVFLGRWRNGRPRDVVGIVISSSFLSCDGKLSRFTNPSRWERGWLARPLGDLGWASESGASYMFLFSVPIPRDLAVLAWEAAARLVAVRHRDAGEAPEEFSPGRWRGGLVIDRPDDPIGPFALPGRASMATSVMVNGAGDDLATAQYWIAQASEVPAVLPVKMPHQDEGGGRGLVGRLWDSLSRRA